MTATAHAMATDAPIPEAPPTDEAGRVRLAARTSTPPELLRLLAEDPALTVRAAVALNPAFAPCADVQLLNDADDRIRMLLAGKVARLLPGLSGADHHAAQAHARTMLMALAGDATVRVRVAIAEAVNLLPCAPRDVILKLAQDPEIAVSDPIVRFSPLLTDADLLELLATPPHPSTAESVASRAGLSVDVADGIAAHADSGAIRALLSNPSAAIQEATLDALIGRAADHPDWHEPLVHRPSLPQRGVLALSRIVAGHLLDTLINRADLPPGLAQELRGRVTDSLATETAHPPPTETEVIDAVRQLGATGQLNEEALLDATSAGDHRRAAAILAAASGVTLPMLDRAVAMRSAKALVSLVWRCGFSMQAAAAVQALLGRLSPGERLVATGVGGFPLSEAEMDWQIELLVEPGR